MKTSHPLPTKSAFTVEPSAADSRDGPDFRWPDIAPAEKVIVKLKGGFGEKPLVLLHGGSGTIHSFGPISSQFVTAVWAIQTTPDTPRFSIAAQARFYVSKIKNELPHGPYRLASFSATSILLLEMAKVLEALGDKISQLAFIDHFPTTFTAPGMGMDPQDDYDPCTYFVRTSVAAVCSMARRDGGGNILRRHKLADGLWDALSGKHVAPFLQTYHDFMQDFLKAAFHFIQDMSMGRESSPTSNEDRLTRWLESLRCWNH